MGRMKHLCRNVKNISVNDKNGISYNNYDTTSMYYDLILIFIKKT